MNTEESFCKIYTENPCNRLQRTVKLQTKRQDEPGETIQETSRSVRKEQVSKGPNWMLGRW
jgi:hypothetical protein